MEALTVYPAPRYRPIVLALAGDSTMTSFPRGALGVADLLERLEVFEVVVFRALLAVVFALAFGLSSVSVMYRRFLSPLMFPGHTIATCRFPI
jgi:hypothetical protein